MIKTRSGIGLSAFALKIIAIFSMLASHIPIILPEVVPQKLSTPLFLFGRLAFPIFAFFIANGWAKTKSKWRYALRLLIMAVLAQIPFSVGLRGAVWNGISSIKSFTTLNIGFSFLIAMASLFVYDLSRDLKLPRFVSLAVALIPSLAFEFLTPFHAEYGYIGVLLVLVMYITRNDPLTFALSTVPVLAISGGMFKFPLFYIDLRILLVYIITVALILTYNGRRGAKAKYLFYIFYPLHIIVLLLIKNIVF